MGKVIKFFTILISLVLIVAAVAVALLAFPIFGNQALIVRSGSMEPNIPVGSIVVTRPADEISGTSLYKEGEVISFKRDANTIVTHRIVGIENTKRGVTYKTKGDANEEPDNWIVKETDVLGKSLLTLPEFGKFLAFAKSKYGFPLLIIFPSALVIIVETVNMIREIFKQNKKRKEALPRNFSESQTSISQISSDSYFTKRNFYSLKILIPIIAFGFFFQSTSAFFSDTETSSGNMFQAASSFVLVPTPTEEPNMAPPECSGMKFSGGPIFGNNGTPNNDLIFALGESVIDGNAGNDCIVATEDNDEIKGGSGNDVIIAGGGDDIIDGDSGNDKIFGGDGEDTLDGGTGKDYCEGESIRRCEL